MLWWVIAAVGVIATPMSSTSAQQVTPAAGGWIEGSVFWTNIIGPHSYRRSGPFIIDERLDDPDKALAKCRRYAKNPSLDGYGSACISFLYPSTRDLPQAAEARAIYESNFKGAMEELRVGATAELLNTIVPDTLHGSVATLGELYAYQYNQSAELVQWLYDRSARLCEKDAGSPAGRFSCIQFYLASDGTRPRIDATRDVLERNGFRPRTAAELDAARRFGPGSPDRDDRRSQARYVALIAPADRARLEHGWAAEAAVRDARRIAEARAAGLVPATPAENLAAARRLGEPDTSVCRPLTRDYVTYRFMATVEGASTTKLQLRAGAIRSENTEVGNVPYRDTRISPGVVFWDDAGLWTAC